MADQVVPRIVKLEESVINRIAAGEVVQRPANAIKELLENSLDAGSTNVQIVIKQGGLKLLQIQDNGHGITEADMPVVCERFTTSKLRRFEDLNQIATFGFRGEALASISHVARVTITTKTTNSQCAYKASFIDGKMSSDLAFCAGNKGTKIVAEDLFYNMPTRKKALQNANEETRRICEVVQKYALHNSKVAISLRRFDENVPDVRTAGGVNAQTVDAVRTIYGNELAKNLLPEMSIQDPKLAFSAHCLCSSADYTGKKFIFLLFVNNRLVECANLKRAIEQIYNIYLPKGMSPFVYISLSIVPQNLDVNVHPTKQQVHFLFEEEIVEMTKRTIDNSLAVNNSSRAFRVDTFSTSTPDLAFVSQEPKRRTSMSSTPAGRPSFLSSFLSSPNPAPAQHTKIRVDNAQQKLDRFFNPKQQRVSLDTFSATPSSQAPALSQTNRPSCSKSAMETNENDARNEDVVMAGGEISPNNNVTSENLEKDIIMFQKEVLKRSTRIKESDTDDDVLMAAYDSMVADVDNASDNKSNVKICEKSQLGFKKEGVVAIPHQAPSSGQPKSSLEPSPSVNVLTVTTRQPSVTNIHTDVERSFRRRNLQLDSLKSLKDDVEAKCHDGILRILSNFSFVGCVDYVYSLLQNESRLMLINHAKLSTEFFYQMALTNFGNMGFLRFNEPLSIEELALIALDSPLSGWKESDGKKADLAVFTRDFLVSKAQMLVDYFSIEIDTDTGSITALPLVIADYLPNFNRLPFFILRLASDVDWQSEKECFYTLCMEIAKFYSVGGPDWAQLSESPDKDALDDSDFKNLLEHTLFLHIKQFTSSLFFPSKQLSGSGGVVEVTSLHELYKVFERC